ncbi:hypothetical protein MSNKSG1_02354 [Marinobacter santoriniensis NKSG1]|uniref:Uncharacterized protein n=1 Tax=Marinobacter santoriniensis NKSG1 TaxID=1288826 RepID=M7CXX5_9GAMM|nr:hypothetical protein [Marinobacter santoriniensis]EMP57100.1 hypothetical protein MSNKSG1_02354 [Marinobacter santoriniensis NKSG1]
MSTEYGFPAIGEIAKELFSCAGFLPTKNDSLGLIRTETEKKSIQTRLRRLAQESSELRKNLDQLMELFKDLTRATTGSERVANAVHESIVDALEQYRDLVRNQISHLGKHETLRFLLLTSIPDRVILSYQKNALIFNVAATGYQFPNEPTWWLPSFSDDGVQWPLSKALNWIYETIETSQTRFHFPDHGLRENYRLKQNYENAWRWTSNLKFPSLTALLSNLDESLEAMRETTHDIHQRDVGPTLRSSFRTVLAIARFSTAAFRKIEKAYGKDVLFEVSETLRKQDRRLRRNHLWFAKRLKQKLIANNVRTPQAIDNAWSQKTQEFWRNRSGNLLAGAQQLAHLQQADALPSEKIPRFRIYIRLLGIHAAHSSIVNDAHARDIYPPETFLHALQVGSELKNRAQGLSQIEELENAVKSNGDDALSWIVEWAKATHFYRAERYSEAAAHFKNAFDLGKYSAGAHQYKLVNQYIEICAKNRNFEEFKKGIAWAKYLGFSTRLLRDQEETEENLKAVYDQLQIVVYPIL